MKILAISDRPPQKNLKDLANKEKVELIVTLGDLEPFDIREIENINLTKIGVYGNHCSGNYFEGLSIQNMHLKTFEYKGIVFGGFEGCIRYKNDVYSIMYTQDEARELLRDFPYVDVFLAHSPPRGINDESDPAHIGFDALREYLEIKKPKYFLHGHTYPKKEDEIKHFCETEIIYVYRDKIIEVFV